MAQKLLTCEHAVLTRISDGCFMSKCSHKKLTTQRYGFSYPTYSTKYGKSSDIVAPALCPEGEQYCASGFVHNSPYIEPEAGDNT